MIGPDSASPRSAVQSTPRPDDTLVNRVYQDLRDAIVSLRIPPGMPLSEGDVSRRFGGSRTPVRAALVRLEREGLLVSVSGGRKLRLSVAPLTAADMRVLFLMVGALNGVAARMAAELPDPERTPLADLLGDINGQLQALADTPDVDVRRVEELDRRFHRTYETLVSAPILALELDALDARRTRYVRVYTDALVHAGRVRESHAEHQALVDAIRAGDGERAERCAAHNYRQALRRFAAVIEARGEQGGWF